MFGIDDRILMYPLDRESLSVVKSTRNYPNIRICGLVSPESWGYDGECYHCTEGMIAISHDYEGGLDNCSAVWVVDSWNRLDFGQFIEPAIRLASEKDKRIVCSRKLTPMEKTSLSDFEVAYVEFSSSIPKVSPDNRVQEIRTPVVFVMSSTEYCNQFFIETALCSELRNREYKTLLISSQKEGCIFEGYTIPDFMFHGVCCENMKVLALNHYIRHLEMNHQPEIIVIGVPGVAMPYNHQYSSDFGILAYEFSEAVSPDFTILSSSCMPYDIKYFEGIEKCLCGRLGIDIDLHSLSQYALDFSESSIEKSLGYFSVDDSFVQETIEQISYANLFNLNQMSGIAAAVDRLIDKLSRGAVSRII